MLPLKLSTLNNLMSLHVKISLCYKRGLIYLLIALLYVFEVCKMKRIRTFAKPSVVCISIEFREHIANNNTRIEIVWIQIASVFLNFFDFTFMSCTISIELEYIPLSLKNSRAIPFRSLNLPLGWAIAI